MKIGLRITLSFLILLIIFIATSVFNLNVFTQSATSFSQSSKVTSDAISIFDIDRQLAELQQIILIYNNTGSMSVIQRAQKIHHHLLNDLHAIHASVTTPSSLVILAKMIKELEDYGNNILALVEARQHRDQLINNTMLSLAAESFRIVQAIKTIAPDEENSDAINQTYAISEHLLTAQVNAVSFFGNIVFKNKLNNHYNKLKKKPRL